MNNNKENVGATASSSSSQHQHKMPDPEKITDFMRQSLDQFQSALVCPLCDKRLKDPATLACSHSFCREVCMNENDLG